MKSNTITFWLLLILGLTMNVSCDKDDEISDKWPSGKEPAVDSDYHPFVREGKVWNYSYDIVETTSDGNSVAAEAYIIKGDTLIQGQKCKKVFYRSRSVSNNNEWHYFAALKEWGKKVYIMRDGKTKGELLYNFGLYKGEHIRYSTTWNDLVCNSVEKIYTSDKESVPRKILGLNVSGNSDYDFPTLIILWIEGIGALDGSNPFNPNCHYDDPLSSLISCYEDGVCIYDISFPSLLNQKE